MISGHNALSRRRSSSRSLTNAAEYFRYFCVCVMVSIFYLLQVSHLFWSAASKATDGKPAKDGKKVTTVTSCCQLFSSMLPDQVVDCLKKGLKIARQCMDAGVQVQLLVEILNHYVLFYEVRWRHILCCVTIFQGRKHKHNS